MFEWLRRVFSAIDIARHGHIHETLDTRNADAGGGKPKTITKALGELKISSGVLELGDPQCMPGSGLRISNIDVDRVSISASLWKYPSGSELLTSLTLTFRPSAGGERRQIGEIGIDSAKVIVADSAALDANWTEKGKDRIGVILTARNDTVLKLLTKRFGFKTLRLNSIRADIVGPVSEDVEREVEAFLKSKPEYADYPFMYFRVQTNNSFERTNFLDKAWGFMPIGVSDTAQMFVCETGRGDGLYDVLCEFAGENPLVVSIDFLNDTPEG